MFKRFKQFAAVATVAVVAGLGSTQSASAAIAPEPITVNLDSLLGDGQNAAGITIGDKHYDNFNFASGGQNPLSAKDVEVVLQRRGLFLAQVYVPEQTLSDGVVTLQVLEGRIGAVKVEVEPGVRIAPERLDRIVATLRGNPVAERELIERALFTLGDLRGIAVSTALTPGDKIGYADLVVNVSKGADLATTIDFDGTVFSAPSTTITLDPNYAELNIINSVTITEAE